jgi:NAD(P)-dependent dehydrogenase (short-subunit alcohol dehydrogenase family)
MTTGTKDFDGKVALVTGAASGIGLACAQTLAARGAAVMLADRSAQAGEQAARGIAQAGGQADFVAVEVTDPDSVQAMVDATVARFGGLHVAVNNAGVGRRTAQDDRYGLEDWHRIIGINLTGVFLCLRAQLPAMAAGGGGSIVNLASILGSVGFPGAAAYTASKHGVVGLTRAAALDNAAQGIRVNAVGPGFIETPMIAHVTAEQSMRDFLVAQHPIGRLGQPQEIANLIAFLASDQASFITGAYYTVDGGYTAR